MTLKWKTTKVERPYGTVHVTHWKKLPPEQIAELVKALDGKPEQEFPHSFPSVRKYRFMQFPLAVRDQTRTRVPPSQGATARRFQMLTKLLRQKSAFFELPFAIVRSPLGHKYITVWKEGTTPLTQFLNDPNVSLDRKRSACEQTFKMLGRLHARGFLHGHPHTENWSINRRGDVKIVDWAGMDANTNEYDQSTELNTVISSILKTGMLPTVAEQPLFARKNPEELKRLANTAYSNGFNAERKQIEASR